MSKKPVELMRVAEVAKALAVSKDLVRRLIALPAENPDRLPSVGDQRPELVIDADEVQRLVEEGLVNR